MKDMHQVPQNPRATLKGWDRGAANVCADQPAQRRTAVLLRRFGPIAIAFSLGMMAAVVFLRSLATPAPVHLNRYHHFTQLMRDPRIEVEKHTYVSDFDDSAQQVTLLRPANGRIERVFVFFHGMDGDAGDAYILGNLVTSAGALVIAPGGRGPAWLSDAFIADATQVIRKYRPQDSPYYLAGVSMGGTQALTLAGLLSEDLQSSLAGVLALIPGADLPSIVRRTSSTRVRDTLRQSVRGNVALLNGRSPINLVTKYKPDLPFVVLRDAGDTILPAADLSLFLEKLRGTGHPVVVFEAPGDHDFRYAQLDYGALCSALGNSEPSVRAVPLLAP